MKLPDLIIVLMGFFLLVSLPAGKLYSQSSSPNPSLEIAINQPTENSQIQGGSSINLDLQINGVGTLPPTMKITFGCADPGYSPLVYTYVLSGNAPYSFQQQINCPSLNGTVPKEFSLVVDLLNGNEMVTNEDLEIVINP